MRRRHISILAAGTALGLCPSIAQSQTTVAAPPSGGAEVEPQTWSGADAAPDAVPSDQAAVEGNGDIIVTAQKRSERLNEVPLSITAASGAQLANAGVTDPSQLVKVVPGFTYQLSQYGTPVFGIRGVSFFDTSGSAAPAVSVYVDQVPLPLSIITRGASLDLERVEVLKGPQGTLFGENATGGAVNYIAAKPTKDLTAGGDLNYGRFDQLEVGGFVSGALSSTVSARLSARTEQRDNWQYSTSRDEGNGERNLNIARLLLDWKPSSTLRFELNVNGWRDKSETQAAQFIRFVPTVPAPQGYPGAIAALSAYDQRPDHIRAANWDDGFSLARNDRFFQTSLRVDWDATEKATLTSLSSFIRYKGYLPTDVDGTDYPDLENTLVDDFDIFSQELRLAVTTGSVRTLLGGNYSYQKLDETGVNFLQATNTQFGPIVADQQRNPNDQKVNTYAAFGSIDWDISSSLTLQGSVRYTKQDREYHGCTADGGDGRFAAAFGFLSTILSGHPVTIAPGACITLDRATGRPAGLLSRDLNDDNLSWRGAISWKPTRDLMIYATATKGYKAGGFSTLPIGFTDQVTSVQQESVLAYEAGVKAELLHGRLQAAGAVFHYDYRNKQIAGSVLIPPFGTLPALVNVPKSRINGAEVSLTGQVTRAVRLSLSANCTDGKVTRSFHTYNPFGVLLDINGDRLPNAPRWQASAEVEYNFAPEAHWQPYVGAGVNYQSVSDAIFGAGPEFELPKRTLVDLRAGAQTDDGKWSVQLFGRNVTNKYYWINVARQIDTVVKFAGFPATYGVNFRFRFQ